MHVRDLIEVLQRLDPHQKMRVVALGSHTGENGPSFRVSYTDPPTVKPDQEAILELIFSNE
jgi:hypothetical protein